MYVYKEIRTRPPHTFKFDIDDKGNVLKVIQRGTNEEKFYRPDLFLHHTYQMQFGNPYGKSDLSAAFSSWKSKKFVDRFFAVYL